MSAAPPSPTEGLPWEALVTSAVHDMRTPLSSIFTTIEILKLLEPSEKALVLLGKLEQQSRELSDQLERLVRDPLSYSKSPSAAPPSTGEIAL